MADYLLFHLNQTAQFDYVSYMKLDAPMDDARLMLAMTALYQGMVKQARDMDTGEKSSLSWGRQITNRHSILIILRSNEKVPRPQEGGAILHQGISLPAVGKDQPRLEDIGLSGDVWSTRPPTPSLISYTSPKCILNTQTRVESCRDVSFYFFQRRLFWKDGAAMLRGGDL